MSRSLSRDDQGRLRPWRQVVHIENRIGVHRGRYWMLTLECGHLKAVSNPNPRDVVRALFHGIRCAPERCRCLVCTVDTPLSAALPSVPMKLLSLAAFLAALSVWMAVPGCAHTQPITDVVKNCASAEIKIIVDNIVPDVQRAFECEPLNKTQLPACLLNAAENLAKQWGQDALNCAVEEYSSPAAVKAALTSLEMIGKTRAKLWLARDRGPGDGPGTAASRPPT